MATNGGRSAGPAKLLGHDRAVAGIFERRERPVAGVDVLRAEIVAPSVWLTPRRIANLSAQSASFGRCSQICTPGTLVVIGRTRRGAVGGVGLQVERVDVGRPAGEVDEDGALGPGGADLARRAERK